MSEYLTLIRKRSKDGSPGKLEMLYSPDDQISDQLDKWSELSQNVVNEEVAEIRVVRLTEHKRLLRFLTKTEAKAKEESDKKFLANQAKTFEDAEKRQKDQAKAQADRDDAERKKKVAQMSAEHDVIRDTLKNRPNPK